ncbi:MAG: ribosome small subunit-dependent GTPase A [Acidimicrobiales bacterium]
MTGEFDAGARPAGEDRTPGSLLKALGWTTDWEELADGQVLSSAEPARVLRHDGRAVLVGRAEGTIQIHLKATTPPVAVGDWVLTDGEAVHRVLPRRSLLHRRDPSTGDEQLIASNVDVVGIVSGLDRPVNPGRIERFVTLAWDAGADPLIVLTKFDLVAERSEFEAIAAQAAPGVDIVCVSAVDGSGIDGLRAMLSGKTVAFVGESGAGKSSLLNALAGREIATTGTVRAGDHKGRHTTSSRQLHVLPGGCCVIDTPGLREVGLWTDSHTVDDAFDDIAELAQGCRFRDCGHSAEPGCAVKEAVQNGTLDPRRLTNWAQLRKEAASAELRSDSFARHQADRRMGKIIRQAQRHPKP